MKSRCGTPGYMAPEIFGSKGYTSTVDVFSLGIILFTLYKHIFNLVIAYCRINGSPPFKGHTAQILIKKT